MVAAVEGVFYRTGWSNVSMFLLCLAGLSLLINYLQINAMESISNVANVGDCRIVIARK